MYDDWDQRPVVTNVATTGLPISAIPFPSVTICSEGVLAEIPLASVMNQMLDFMAMKKIPRKAGYAPKTMSSAFLKQLNVPKVNFLLNTGIKNT
jgi:hypothetical protein